MKKLTILFLLQVFLCIPLFSNSDIKKTVEEIDTQPDLFDGNTESLKDYCLLLLNRSDYKKTIIYSTKLRKVGQALKDSRYEMYGDICLGQSLLMIGREDSARYHLDHSLLLATKLKNDSALCSVYNGLGLYAANIRMDYYSAISYFFQGIEAAKRSSYERLHTVLLLNLAGIYYLKKDPVGLKYSLECYDIGIRKDDPFLIYTAAANVAYMYYLTKDYSQALKYIEEAESIMLQHKYYDQSKIYTLHGHILFALGKDSEAMSNFKKALQYIDQAQASSISDTYLGYADVLIKKGNYQEAIINLKKSLEWSMSQKNVIYRTQAIKRLSEVYELIGNDEQALVLYKQYHLVTDSIFNIDKERSLNEQRIKFDLESSENKMQEQQLIIQAKEKQLYTFAFLILILSAFVIVVYLAYRRKNKLYTRIVEQNQKAIKRETKLKEQIKQLRNDSHIVDVTDKHSGSSLSDEKNRQIFLEVERLMNEQYIYREKELTRERVAEILQTNRTYLSQVINQQTGLSFTHYINSYRINEAVRILSDPTNTVPLKNLAFELGFSSINTFYNSFQTIVGMSPSTYRKKASELTKNL